MSLQPEPLEQAKIIIERKITASRSKANKELMRDILNDLNGIEEDEHSEPTQIAKCDYLKSFIDFVNKAGGSNRVSRLIGCSYDTINRMFEADSDDAIQPAYITIISEGRKYAYWRSKAKKLEKKLKELEK